jgi:Mce-associated membrane protein
VADDTPDGPLRPPAGPASTPASGATATDVQDPPAPEPAAGEESSAGGAERPGKRRRQRLHRPAAESAADGGDPGTDDRDTGADTADPGKRRPSLPLVPVLAVLLVLLLAGCLALWLTRPAHSAVRTADYVGALQAARAGIVDVASFDYVTLDDDIQQIRNVTTGDLQKESVDQLDQRRQQITDAQAVVDTTVVGAAVGTADHDKATVFAVIQSTQKTRSSPQAQVQRYRVEIALERIRGRWLLSGITGR